MLIEPATPCPPSATQPLDFPSIQALGPNHARVLIGVLKRPAVAAVP